MKLDMERVVEIPEGFNVSVDGKILKVSGNGKEVSKNVDFNRINVEVVDGKAVISVKKGTKRESAIMGTLEAHLKNMIKGLQEDFVYELEICNVHFPMSVKAEGDKIVINSFLGEKTSRVAKIDSNSKVDIKGTKITVTSHSIESAGQTAANIEKAAKLTGRDRRIFQDGIFITEKPGRTI